METKELVRAFRYNSVDLPDPGPQHTIEQVRDLYAVTYPEIVSAAVEGPEEKEGKLVYTFRRAVGTKGVEPERIAAEAARRPLPSGHGAVLGDRDVDYTDLVEFGQVTIRWDGRRTVIDVYGFEFRTANTCRQKCAKAFAWARDVLATAARAEKLIPGAQFDVVAAGEIQDAPR